MKKAEKKTTKAAHNNRSLHYLNRAIFYMIFATLCFTAQNSAIRFVDHLETTQLVFFRSFGSVIFCLFVLIRNGIPIGGNNKKILLLRSATGLTGMFLFFYALQIMPMASAVSLRYLSPFFTALFAMWLLKERVIKWQWLCFLIAFIGVIMLKGFDLRISAVGLIVTLSCAVISGLVYTIIRKIGKSEHPVVVVNYFMSFSAIVGGIGCLFFWKQPEGWEWLALASLGLFGFFGQLYMTKSLQNAEANLVTPFKYAEVIFTIIAGWMIFSEYQTVWTIFAMLIIVIGLVLNVYVKEKFK